MNEEPDVEGQLHRAVLLRRTVTGVGAVASGIAALILGARMIGLPFQGDLGRRGMISSTVISP